MQTSNAEFTRGQVRAVDCFKEGWGHIKEQYWLLLGITVVGILISSLAPLAILAGPMLCGIYGCILLMFDGKRIDFAELFRGFDVFLQSLIATLLSLIPTFLILIPFYIGQVAVILLAVGIEGSLQETGIQPQPAHFLPAILIPEFFLLFFLFAALIAVGVLFLFSYPLVMERRMTGPEAVWLSIRGAWANFWPLLWLMTLGSLICLAGVICCYVGVFFVAPIYLAAVTAAYRRIFPKPEEA